MFLCTKRSPERFFISSPEYGRNPFVAIHLHSTPYQEAKPFLLQSSDISFHCLHLTRSINGGVPADTLWGVQFRTGLDAVDDVEVVEDARLDEAHAVAAAERVAVPPQRRPAVAAERARDLLARVRDLRDLLRCPRQDLEVRHRYHDVVAVVAPGYLAAVCAVAQGLVSVSILTSGSFQESW
jgi:hypothetical protein